MSMQSAWLIQEGLGWCILAMASRGTALTSSLPWGAVITTVRNGTGAGCSAMQYQPIASLPHATGKPRFSHMRTARRSVT